MLLLSECCMCTDAHTVGWISLICMMASFEVWWCSKMAYCYWSTDSFSCVNLINWVNDSFLGMFSCLLQFIATYCFPLSQMFGDQQHLYFTPACENSKEKIKASPPNTLWTHKRTAQSLFCPNFSLCSPSSRQQADVCCSWEMVQGGPPRSVFPWAIHNHSCCHPFRAENTAALSPPSA